MNGDSAAEGKALTRCVKGSAAALSRARAPSPSPCPDLLRPSLGPGEPGHGAPPVRGRDSRPRQWYGARSVRSAARVRTFGGAIKRSWRQHAPEELTMSTLGEILEARKPE